MASGSKPTLEKRVFGEKINLCRLCRWPLQGVPSIAQDPVRPCAVQQPDGLASGLPSPDAGPAIAQRTDRIVARFDRYPFWRGSSLVGHRSDAACPH